LVQGYVIHIIIGTFLRNYKVHHHSACTSAVGPRLHHSRYQRHLSQKLRSSPPLRIYCNFLSNKSYMLSLFDLDFAITYVNINPRAYFLKQPGNGCRRTKGDRRTTGLYTDIFKLQCYSRTARLRQKCLMKCEEKINLYA
jgi:hypothetical protein